MSDVKRPHGSRFRDALAIINRGACNPSGIALSIVEACREIREHETSATAALWCNPCRVKDSTSYLAFADVVWLGLFLRAVRGAVFAIPLWRSHNPLGRA